MVVAGLIASVALSRAVAVHSSPSFISSPSRIPSPRLVPSLVALVALVETNEHKVVVKVPTEVEERDHGCLVSKET